MRTSSHCQWQDPVSSQDRFPFSVTFPYHSSAQLECIRHADSNADGLQTEGNPGRKRALCFLECAKKKSKWRHEKVGEIVGAVFIRCSLFKGRRAISRRPIGIEIYLSRATPIGSIHGAAPPFISFHSHVLHMQYLQKAITQQALRHVCMPGVTTPSAVFCRVSLTFPYRDRHL